MYHAIELNFLNPIYVLPKLNEAGIDGEIEPEEIKKIIEEHQDIKLIVITSPTYEGVISNIKEITKIAHSYSIPVLVDEAHGAHLNFVEKLKEKEALNAGADIVIQSLHKTLPALTQTAIIHCQGKLVEEDEIQRQLAIFQTSSPSYILMASIEECLTILQKKGKELFEQYENNLKEFYKQAQNLKKLKILGNLINKTSNYDIGKIVVITENTNINGKMLAKILREQYKIETEMANTNYVIAMTSICDKKENFERLIEALKKIDGKIEYCQKVQKSISRIIPKKGTLIKKIENSTESKFVNYKETSGKVIEEYIWIYPPGIPIIAPGEIMTGRIIKLIEDKVNANIEVYTSFGEFPNIKIEL